MIKTLRFATSARLERVKRSGTRFIFRLPSPNVSYRAEFALSSVRDIAERADQRNRHINQHTRDPDGRDDVLLDLAASRVVPPGTAEIESR